MGQQLAAKLGEDRAQIRWHTERRGPKQGELRPVIRLRPAYCSLQLKSGRGSDDRKAIFTDVQRGGDRQVQREMESGRSLLASI